MSESSSAATPSAEQKARALYDMGNSIVYASRSDPRFSYCTHAPRHLDAGAKDVRLVVVMHGTGRAFSEYRDDFAEFAKWNDCIVLCPLFPAGVRGDGNRDGFKHLIEGDIRYDRVLLDMVAEVGEKYGHDFSRFALFGFSGGGQFVNRFALLHPDRLWAVSIGAPGSVTRLDPGRDWWVGTRNFAERFGREIDLDALRRLPVHMVVGKADLETWEITHKEGGKFFMPGANDAGRTRPERLESLRQSFEAAGVKVRLDTVENVAHNGHACVGPVQDFFAEVLRGLRGGTA
jgi:pimeloyl-ACP methyl ester carboxylesterase